ncbi:patatin-like phospholipase family protein [Hydrogenophaga sp.]|uniref:patatin-like phospholipase family protein n=1 Tax=Hydrogenophaga sp. TaxID=1904254 RepID=UPI002C16B1D1|nr:patatin-like phospholipase family protein [Hydrogenophaga sp.]HMP10516.1 patatin-like phospholipase family protein [Hydrogenophaga sp.]
MTSARRPTHPSRRARRQEHQLIDLALQGGGSHGAFTWGVLDRLLQEESLEIAGVSGTSAGAMNAVALAAGLMEGGREGARESLGRFWRRVAKTSPFHALEMGPLASLWGPDNPWLTAWTAPWRQAASLLGSQLSPYQLNPLNLNPLRDVLNETIDFDQVCGCHKTQLFIAATQVRTGALRTFRQHELSVDVVLASACLPLLFQAVEIDGESYWDGGYAGNPTLLPLIKESPANDLLLVQINPSLREELPTRADAILDRINEVTFNASLLKEMRSIALLQQLIADEGRPGHHYRNPLFARVEALKVHRVDGGEALAALGAATKTQTQWPFLSMLFDRGVEAADRWLHTHRGHIGQRSTLDLAKTFGA